MIPANYEENYDGAAESAAIRPVERRMWLLWSRQATSGGSGDTAGRDLGRFGRRVEEATISRDEHAVWQYMGGYAELLDDETYDRRDV